MLHLNHMEGVVGPPALLVKLNVARQPFKVDLGEENVNEENKLVRVPRGGGLAAVRSKRRKDCECSHVFWVRGDRISI